MSLIHLFVAARNAAAERRRAYDELTSLDDRSLADIGIHRSQIPNLVMSFEQAAQVEAAPFAGPTSAFGHGFAAGHR